MESLLPIDDRTRVMQTWSITRNGSVDLVENNVELGEGTRSTRNESKPRMSTLVASWSLPFMQLRQLISPVQWCSWRHRGVSCGMRRMPCAIESSFFVVPLTGSNLITQHFLKCEQIKFIF